MRTGLLVSLLALLPVALAARSSAYQAQAFVGGRQLGAAGGLASVVLRRGKELTSGDHALSPALGYLRQQADVSVQRVVRSVLHQTRDSIENLGKAWTPTEHGAPPILVGLKHRSAEAEESVFA